MTSPADPTLAARARAVLPLRAPAFHVLLALSAGALTGYRMRQRVEEQSDGAVRLWPATLYRTLGQLQDDGWIEETEAADAPDDAVDRRFYSLTALGGAVLSAETERLAALVRLARSARPRPGEA